MLSSKCSICGNKKIRLTSKKELEESGLLSNLEIKTPVSNIPRLNILF